ncbi:MAG: hypothetical protein AAGB93_13895 [Planctomycetota bacterium]
MPQPSSQRPRLDLPSVGVGALLALGVTTLLSAQPVASQADEPTNRFQIRTISQESGAAAVVMVDSKTGQAWAQRLASGNEPLPWTSLGKPK